MEFSTAVAAAARRSIHGPLSFSVILLVVVIVII